MSIFDKESVDILCVISNYFEGVFYGDLNKLKATFHPNCILFGDVNGQPYQKELHEYMESVRNRKSSNELGEPFDMNVLGIEVLNNIATVKAKILMMGFNYYDYLSLSKRNGKWWIVSKVFTNV